MATVLTDLSVVAMKDGQELFVMNVIRYNVKLGIQWNIKKLLLIFIAHTLQHCAGILVAKMDIALSPEIAGNYFLWYIYYSLIQFSSAMTNLLVPIFLLFDSSCVEMSHRMEGSDMWWMHPSTWLFQNTWILHKAVRMQLQKWLPRNILQRTFEWKSM